MQQSRELNQVNAAPEHFSDMSRFQASRPFSQSLQNLHDQPLYRVKGHKIHNRNESNRHSRNFAVHALNLQCDQLQSFCMLHASRKCFF
mmetsp:Transcript_104261/g.185287  ORF Transcript_104261/g.185287 Transcript_104261/m.185287 type:complete len:89 (+) Transcript_104261:1281-1547(+)